MNEKTRYVNKSQKSKSCVSECSKWRKKLEMRMIDSRYTKKKESKKRSGK